ncbi:MAG TPA: hypothetical protein VFF49_11785 [Thermodesulfobacteriota bacterium]|nr:hypothetical protein [Thermodesulfobacteriota bacterium]
MPSRIIWISVAFLFLWFPPKYGNTEPQLYSVRVGNHGKFSRVVFDFNKDTPYEIIPEKDPFKIVVEFDNIHPTQSHAVFWVLDPIVQEVIFIDTTTKTRAVITLKKGGIVKKHFRLSAPPRIVLDIAHDTSISFDNSIKTFPIQEPQTNQRGISHPQEEVK